jgi:hypothetical protein
MSRLSVVVCVVCCICLAHYIKATRVQPPDAISCKNSHRSSGEVGQTRSVKRFALAYEGVCR